MWGVSGAVIDYAVQLTKVRDVARHYLENDCPEDFKKVIDSYCAGANAYFAHHWDELSVKRGFPIESVDVVSGYMLGMSLMAGIDKAIEIHCRRKTCRLITQSARAPYYWF